MLLIARVPMFVHSLFTHGSAARQLPEPEAFYRITPLNYDHGSLSVLFSVLAWKR
jgi:hypothetical protein